MPDKKDPTKGKNKTKILPQPDRARTFEQALASVNKKYAGTLKKLAK